MSCINRSDSYGPFHGSFTYFIILIFILLNTLKWILNRIRINFLCYGTCKNSDYHIYQYMTTPSMFLHVFTKVRNWRDYKSDYWPECYREYHLASKLEFGSDIGGGSIELSLIDIILEKKNTVGRLALPDFKTFHKAGVVKAGCYWRKKRQINGAEESSEMQM